MATCNHCDNEMTTACSCKEGIDESAIAGEHNCYDCGCSPGSCHHPGCDTERCGCGGQAIVCGCPDADYWSNRTENRWTGLWAGDAECEHFNLYCRDLVDGKPVDIHTAIESQGVQWHVPCKKDDEGAHFDLNRWAARGRPQIPK